MDLITFNKFIETLSDARPQDATNVETFFQSNKKNVILVARVSTKNQNIKSQAKYLRACMKMLNVKYTKQIESVGSAWDGESPLELNESKTVYVFSCVDRFSRDYISALHVFETLISNKCAIVFLNNDLVISRKHLHNYAKVEALIQLAQIESMAKSMRTTLFEIDDDYSDSGSEWEPSEEDDDE